MTKVLDAVAANNYWTVRESEYSTDVMLESGLVLSSLYPNLLEHAVRHFHSEDVLPFLGRRINVRYKGEVKSNYKGRVEGTCVKHWVEENSIEMYDKQERVLRVETTVNNCRRWRVWRRTARRGKRCMAWIRMRKSIADLRRRAEVSRAANGRYLDALAVVGESSAAGEVLDPLARRVMLNGRPYRALRPVAPEDAALLSAINAHGQGNDNKSNCLDHYDDEHHCQPEQEGSSQGAPEKRQAVSPHRAQGDRLSTIGRQSPDSWADVSDC